MLENTKEKIEEIEEKSKKYINRIKKFITNKTFIKKSPNKMVANQNTIDSKAASKEAASINVASKKISSTNSTKTTSKKLVLINRATRTLSKSNKKFVAKKILSKSQEETTKSKSPIEILEYYDLPYRYNQTVVKILAQTPNTLFIYWDISDEDKQQYINQYGEYFFNNTKPVLVVHNKTMNYSFEIDINDFANSWYLNVRDSNCNYQVELGRKPINQYVKIPNNYLYITVSNDYITQNDHILLDRLSHIVYFRNVKTNETIAKNIADFTLLQKIGKFDVEKFYKILYPDEVSTFEEIHLENPSSR